MKNLHCSFYHCDETIILRRFYTISYFIPNIISSNYHLFWLNIIGKRIGTQGINNFTNQALVAYHIGNNFHA